MHEGETSHLGITREPGEFIHWDNRLARPHRQINHDEFELTVHCNLYSMVGQRYSQVYLPCDEGLEWGHRKHGMYACREYWWQTEAVAHLSQHHYDREEAEKAQRELGGDILVSPNNGYYHVLYYRLGCEHPRPVYTNPFMFEHHYRCPDCGAHWGYDSSG